MFVLLAAPHFPGLLSLARPSPCALEALRLVVGGATMTTPGGAGTLCKRTDNFLRARRTGFSHRVGVPHHTGLRPFFLPLFTGVHGRRILRTSPQRSSTKFVLSMFVTFGSEELRKALPRVYATYSSKTHLLDRG